MKTEADFLRGLLQSPEDALLRRAYADWLEERGDPRARFLRRESEHQRGQPLVAAGSHPDVDIGWLALVTHLARPFTPDRFGWEQELPFSEPIGLRGGVVTFASQFRETASFQPGLIDDLRLVAGAVWGCCYYGSSDYSLEPFLCEIAQPQGEAPTGAEVLRALRTKHFRSEHIRTLDATTIPAPGYQPGTANDEIHNDPDAQYIFWREEPGEFDPVSDQNHSALRQHVRDKQLWYALLHTDRGKVEFPFQVFLFAVGLSADGKRLVGVVTQQNCHNLCD